MTAMCAGNALAFPQFFIGGETVADTNPASLSDTRDTEDEFQQEILDQIGSFGVIDFEDQPLQSFMDPLVLINTVPATTVDFEGDDVDMGGSVYSGVLTQNDLNNGFNVTPSGEKHLRFQTQDNGPDEFAKLNFEFDFPINAFGFYLTGTFTDGDAGDLEITFADGSSAIFSVEPTPSIGNVLYLGLIDTMNPFTKVTYCIDTSTTTEDIGIDDVTIASFVVPVPAPLFMVAGGMIGLIGLRRKQ